MGSHNAIDDPAAVDRGRKLTFAWAQHDPSRAAALGVGAQRATTQRPRDNSRALRGVDEPAYLPVGRKVSRMREMSPKDLRTVSGAFGAAPKTMYPVLPTVKYTTTLYRVSPFSCIVK
jgi:hypothetical protein